jgi:hypothetical protein
MIEHLTSDGREWADMRYLAPRKNAKDPRDDLMFRLRICRISPSSPLS